MTRFDRPLLSVREPSAGTIERFLERQRGAAPIVDPRVDATHPGFDDDHTRVVLGQGPDVFAAARGMIVDWRMFPAPLTRIVPAGAPIRVGTIVAVLARGPGFWLLNACRVVWVVDEARRFGFVYATLPAHIESGAERFLVETDDATGEVVYDLRAYSRPSHWLSRLGKPLVRGYQARFRRESARAMRAGSAGAGRS